MLFKTIRPTLFILAALAGCLVGSTPGRAELPPSAYEKLQADAPESLAINVLTLSSQVTFTKGDKITSVELKASVTKVNRTATGLTPGASITITYKVTEHSAPWAGPSQVTIPKKGQDCPAYLKRDDIGDGRYQPAAGGYAFRKLH